jgi:hypothetical protein
VLLTRLDVDPRLRLAPRGPRHLVVQPLLDEDLDPAERVDEVGEADEVDERVVVDPDREQSRHGLLQVAGAGLAAARASVERVDRLLERRPLRPERHLREVAGHAEGDGPARAVLDGREDDRVGAGAPVARSLVGAEQQDRRPRLRCDRLCIRDDARVGLERRHLTGSEPFHERPLPRVLGYPLWQGMDDVGEQHRAAVARRAAGLLVGEDALEHVVAAYCHPRRRHVRRCGERDEGGDEDRKGAASGVDDGEHAKRQQGEIDREDRRYDRAVDPGEGVQRDPRPEDRAADDDAHPEDEQ